MEAKMEQLKKYARDNNISLDDLSKAAGMNLATFYRKMKKGRKSFTIGELQGMVDSKVIPEEDAIRIFLS